MLVILPLEDRVRLLPYFIEHYCRLGATHFAVALWNGERNPLFDQVAAVLQAHRNRDGAASRKHFTHSLHTSVTCNRAALNANSVNEGLNNVRSELASMGRWYCIADLDEFIWFRGRSFAQMTADAEAHGYTALSGAFVDRIAADGSLPEMPEWRPADIGTGKHVSLDVVFPLACRLSELIGAYCVKVSVARSQVAIGTGHHFVALPSSQIWHDALDVHHFKWQAGVREHLEDRYKRYTKSGLPFASESKRALEWITPRIDIDKAELAARRAQRLGI